MIGEAGDKFAMIYLKSLMWWSDVTAIQSDGVSGPDLATIQWAPIGRADVPSIQDDLIGRADGVICTRYSDCRADGVIYLSWRSGSKVPAKN